MPSRIEWQTVNHAGNVQNAAPATVLPQSLCRSFVHEQAYPLIENEYKNGESQRSVLATNSRKRWLLAKRLTAATLQTLRAFYDPRNGSTEPFYFYDPYERNPRFSYDPTGQATTGPFTVRFNGDWQQASGPGRSDMQIELLELALENTMTTGKITAVCGVRGSAFPAIKPGATAKRAFAAASVQSAAVNSRVVRVVSSSDCHIAFGSNPTAAAGGNLYITPAL